MNSTSVADIEKVPGSEPQIIDGNQGNIHTRFEQSAIENEQRHLKYYTSNANQDQQETVVQRRIINLSLIEIATNISTTFINIINDLMDDQIPKDVTGLITIFFQGDRMVYLGIIVLIVALAIYIIDVSR